MTTENPAPNAPGANPGTILEGFLLGWLAGIGGSVLGGFLMAMLAMMATSSVEPLFVLASLTPVGAVIGLLIWFSRQGKSRSVRGVLYAFGSMILVFVVLVGGLLLLFANADFR
jgi:hypothetical protein